MKNSIIALIPARKGSERIKNKNIALIGKHPLIAYSINSAIKSNIFQKIVVSTDSNQYAKIANHYGSEVLLRPKKISSSSSPDYEWIKFTINSLNKMGKKFTHFCILRPTSPFRDSYSIKKAWKNFKSVKNVDSLRAVQICSEHPYKMWKLGKTFIKPMKNIFFSNQPSYNCQKKIFPKVYIQNASLEISKTSVLKKYKTITGKKIIPFFQDEFKSLDINTRSDLEYARYINEMKKIKVDKILKKPYKF